MEGILNRIYGSHSGKGSVNTWDRENWAGLVVYASTDGANEDRLRWSGEEGYELEMRGLK